MVKRVAALVGMILIVLTVGIGVGLMPANPAAQATLFITGGAALWVLVRCLRRTGDIWKFTAPYP